MDKDQDKKISGENNQGKNMDKYLTDMKELPPTSEPVPEVKKTPEKKVVNNKEEPVEISSTKRTEEKNTSEIKDLPVPDEKSGSIFTFKDIVLGIINLVTIVLVIVLLNKLPLKAVEYQTAKIEEIQNQVNPESEFGNIEEDKAMAEKMEALFLDEGGVVDFVNDVEKMKTENGAIKKVTFPSPRAVKDDTGTFGIPVIIELQGNWQTVGVALEQIQGLPYLFRPVSIDAGPSKDDPNVLVFNYGGLLYVNDRLGQNR